MPVLICKNDTCNFFKYDSHPVAFELYLPLTQEGSNAPLKWNVFGNIYFCPNTQTFISLQT